MAGERSIANPQGTYNVRALREQILDARKKGATTEELLSELSQHGVLGPKIAKMLEAGVSPEQAINNVAVIQKEEKYDPTEGMSELGKFGAGMVSSFTKAGRGVKQVLGSPFVDQATREKWAKENADEDKIHAPLRNTTAGMLGEIFGDVGTTMVPGMGATGAALKLIPKVGQAAGALNLAARGGRALAGAAAGGAGAHLVTPESTPLDSPEAYLSKFGRGAAEGVVGDVGGRVAGRLIKPLRFGIDPAHRERLARLIHAGVGERTPANRNLGAFDLAQLTDDRTAVDLKSALSKLPLFSSSVQHRTNAQLGDFTSAATSRAGTTVRTASPENLSEVKKALDIRNEGFKTMDPIKLDPLYVQAVNDALKTQGRPLSSVPASALDPLRNAKKVARGNRTTIPAKEAVESRGDLSAQAHSAFMAHDPIKGRSYEAAQDALDDAISRGFNEQSPGAAKAWDAYRGARGASLDIEAAAGSANGRLPGDYLNPKTLAAQVRTSQGRGRVATGAAGDLAMLADDASRVISDQIPNSGTPQRALYSMLLLGGIGGLSGGAKDENTWRGGALGTAAGLLAGPMLAKHAMYGRGFGGAKHLAHGMFGEKASNKAIEELLQASPAFAAALIETLRQREEGNQ